MDAPRLSAAALMRGWIAQLVGILVAAVLLAGCTHVTLVPAYDEQIDTGLTELYGDTVVFVDRMIAAAGTPEGTFDANTQFYDEAFGRIEALIVRAEAHRVLSDCPSTKLMTRALANANLPADVRTQIGSLPQDDCQVVLLKLIRDGYDSMRDIHKLRGARGLPPEAKGQFIEGGVGAQLRAAIVVEIAKRGA